MTMDRRPVRKVLSPSTFLCLLLGALLVDLTAAQSCPSECSCFGTFVSCYAFTESSLDDLPSNADTLVLNNGQINSFPPGFASRFPQLTLLDIQSTQVKTVLNGTFSGLRGLDQLAITDCQLGTVESDAFSNISAVSQVLISNSVIDTIRSGAFSMLSNIGEFSIWHTQIERVESGAFRGMSDFSSFAFYMNNVSLLNSDAFLAVENFGKVDIYMNKFSMVKGNALIALGASTSDMNMYSNTFPCSCGVARIFAVQLMARFRISQKCRTAGDGRVLRLSDVDVKEICANEPSTLPSTSSLPQTSTPSPVESTRKPTTFVYTATHIVRPTSTDTFPRSSRGGGSTSTSDPVDPASTSAVTEKAVSATSPDGGSSKQGSSSRDLNGAGCVTQASIVLALSAITVVRVTSGV